jgi:hypothetical protein
MFTFQAIQILVFLLPGFFSEMIVRKLVVKKEKTELQSVIEALVFSLITYVLYSVIISRSPIELRVNGDPSADGVSTFTVATTNTLWLLLISILVSVIWVIILNYDLDMKLLRKLKITKRSGYENAWLGVFEDKQQYIVLNFADGRRLMGWPKCYSDDDENQCLYLTRPYWIVDGEYKKMDVDGIFITDKLEIESIEFLPKKSK